MLPSSSVLSHIEGHLETIKVVAEREVGTITAIADMLRQAMTDGGTIYLCGNGGSAADAQHVAAELVGRYLRNRAPLPAVALTTDTSVLTAIGNVYDYSQIFARQVRAFVTDKDIVVGISTSGKSPNILLAMQAAKERGARTVGFTGTPGEPLASQVDLCFQAPTDRTPWIQETHILIWHIICQLIETSIGLSR